MSRSPVAWTPFRSSSGSLRPPSSDRLAGRLLALLGDPSGPLVGPLRAGIPGKGPIRGICAQALRFPCGSLAGGLRLAPQSSSCRRNRRRRTGHREYAVMNAKNIAKSSTARKVVGSLGVLGAAAAVAGMGTFGTFTDSSTPISSTIASGTLSIDVTQQGVTVPVTTSNFVPGDSVTQAVSLINKGSAGLGSVTLNTTATPPATVLTSDTTNGLQMELKSCSVAWSATNTCSGT